MGSRDKFNTIHTLSSFMSQYEKQLKTPSCVSCCMEDLLGGCKIYIGTADTFRQVLVKISLNGKLPLPVVFHNPLDLLVLSNKRNTVYEVFKLFDTRANNRIDVLELLAVISISTGGTLEARLANSFFIFGFTEHDKLTKEEFHYFLDCLFRGVAKVTLREDDTYYPRFPNKRISAQELTNIVHAIFGNATISITVEEFLSWLVREKGSMNKFLNLFGKVFQECIEKAREIMVSRLKLIPFIKHILTQDIFNNVALQLNLK